MVLHAVLAVVLVIPFATHASAHWPRLKPADMASRRAALRTIALGGAGFALWRGLDVVSTVTAADRRFTGSREEASLTGNAHPVTNWLGDQRQHLNRESWRLAVGGEVRTPRTLGYEDIEHLATSERRATLDCTGGWHTTQDWTGVPLGALLAAAEVREDARSVVVRSVTGYSRRFPLGEARGLLARDTRRGRAPERGARLPGAPRRAGPARLPLGEVGRVDRGERAAGVVAAAAAAAVGRGPACRCPSPPPSNPVVGTGSGCAPWTARRAQSTCRADRVKESCRGPRGAADDAWILSRRTDRQDHRRYRNASRVGATRIRGFRASQLRCRQPQRNLLPGLLRPTCGRLGVACPLPRPEDGDGVVPDEAIGSDDGEPMYDRVRNEEPVERIAVELRQFARLQVWRPRRSRVSRCDGGGAAAGRIRPGGCAGRGVPICA